MRQRSCRNPETLPGKHENPPRHGNTQLAHLQRASEVALRGDWRGRTRAGDDARRGVITHLTIGGVRVAAIVPESLIEALRAAEDAEDAAEADAAMDEPGHSVPWEQVKAELGL